MNLNELKDAVQTETNLEKALPIILKKLESGTLRITSPKGLGADCGIKPMTNLKDWVVHDWVKKSVQLIIKHREVQERFIDTPYLKDRPQSGRLGYFDKLDPRQDITHARIVPPANVREGSFIGKGVVVMPAFTNIGCYVGEGTMVDSWVTVGSCSQIGTLVHLSAGVGVGGVLEPLNAKPVMIGDHAFIGMNSSIVEGLIIESHAVLAAHTCLTASTPIYDVTEKEIKEYRGYVPSKAVVIPGTRKKETPAGEISIQCAYIIAYRSEKHDDKLKLNEILRDYGASM